MHALKFINERWIWTERYFNALHSNDIEKEAICNEAFDVLDEAELYIL